MKLPYQEGDWFAMPLPSGGFAVGTIARAAKGGKALLGYFFSPRRSAVPGVEDLESLDAPSAVVVARFGDLALIRDEWPILGRTAGWNRNLWSMPAFGGCPIQC